MSLKTLIYVAVAIALLVCGLLAAQSWRSRVPPELGLVDGRLKPCDSHRNCVSSDHPGTEASVDPLGFKTSPANAWNNIKQTIAQFGGEVEQESDGYLRAVFTTRVFRVVDDVELRMDAANKRIHVRSASRVGVSDLGTNRKRVERIRSGFRIN